MENESPRREALNLASPPNPGASSPIHDNDHGDDGLPLDPLGYPLDAFAFTPVPAERARHDGWSADRQRRFVAALSVMGSVGKALKAVGMGRVSAYALRKRAGAESFAAAWDRALYNGQTEQYTYAMDRAINGYTVIRVRRGGVVEVEATPDLELMRAAVREGPRR